MDKNELQKRAGITEDMEAFYEMRSHLAAALRAAVRSHSDWTSEIKLLLDRIDGTASGR